MAAGIERFELKVGVDLFAGLNRGQHALVAVSLEFAAVEIDAVFGVDPVAMIFHQPIDAVEIAAFFVGGEREDQVAIGLVVLFLHANEVGDEDGVAFLHVVGAAAVEVAVFFNELKRIGGPVFAARFDDVEMADEEDRLALTGAVDAGDEIFLAVVGAGDDDVVAGEAGVAQASGHGFGGGGDVADGVGRVDFDELLKDFARERIRRGGLGTDASACNQHEN